MAILTTQKYAAPATIDHRLKAPRLPRVWISHGMKKACETAEERKHAEL